MDSVATNSIFFVGGLLVAVSILVSSVSSRVGIPILVIFMGTVQYYFFSRSIFSSIASFMKEFKLFPVVATNAFISSFLQRRFPFSGGGFLA